MVHSAVTAGTERRTLTEADLFAGYRAEARVESCVCGALITAPRNDWGVIGATLRVHYLGTQHQVYRTDRGL